MDIVGMQNARLGTIYLWQGVNYKSPLADAVLGGVMTSVSGILGTKEINVAEFGLGVEVAAVVADSRAEGAHGFRDKIKQWSLDLVGKLWGKIKDCFGDVAEIPGTLKGIALFVTQQIFAKAAPFIGGATGFIQGLWKTGSAIVEKVGNWMARKGVNLTFGHPKTLVNGIEHGITRALLEGIYETIRSAVSLGLNAASFGGAAIVDAVTGIVEAAVKIIWRIAEAKIVNRFISDAKNFWNSRGTSSGMHLDSAKFDNWLKPATKKVPLIAAVTLGSGISGDKMRLLKMYTDHGQTISESSFRSGCAYLDQVKRSGARLIERADLDFSSKDQIIDGLLKLSSSHAQVDSTKRGIFTKLFRATDKFMRA